MGLKKEKYVLCLSLQKEFKSWFLLGAAFYFLLPPGNTTRAEFYGDLEHRVFSPALLQLLYAYCRLQQRRNDEDEGSSEDHGFTILTSQTKALNAKSPAEDGTIRQSCHKQKYDKLLPIIGRIENFPNQARFFQIMLF